MIIKINKDVLRQKLAIKDGVDGTDGIDGKDGVGLHGEDGKSFDPQLLQEELTKLKEEVLALIEEKTQNRQTWFGAGKTRIKLIDLSSQLNGALKTFLLGLHYGIISVQSSSAPYGAFRETTDYVEAGRNITFTANVDAASALATGQSLIVKVLK